MIVIEIIFIIIIITRWTTETLRVAAAVRTMTRLRIKIPVVAVRAFLNFVSLSLSVARVYPYCFRIIYEKYTLNARVCTVRRTEPS